MQNIKFLRWHKALCFVKWYPKVSSDWIANFLYLVLKNISRHNQKKYQNSILSPTSYSVVLYRHQLCGYRKLCHTFWAHSSISNFFNKDIGAGWMNFEEACIFNKLLWKHWKALLSLNKGANDDWFSRIYRLPLNFKKIFDLFKPLINRTKQLCSL